MNKPFFIPFILFLGTIGLSTAGCGKGFEINSEIGKDLSFFKNSGSAEFIPESDGVRSDCATSGELCLYLKNPVFQEQRLIAATDGTGLTAAQKFSVKLTGLEFGSSLKNSALNILSVSGGPFSWSALLESKALGSVNPKYPLAGSAYYWLNRANEYLSKSYPQDFVPTPMTVYVDDFFDGYSYETRSMHLSQKERSALSADLLLVLFGEAQAGIASHGKVYEGAPGTHRSCGGNVKGCCSSSAGCSRALLRGSGDAMLNMLMPSDAAGVGEFHRQSLTGQDVCGRGRNLENFKTVTFSQAHSLCAGRAGSTLALGLVYASVWSEVRLSAALTAGATPAQVDRVFLRVLSRLDGQDTFVTAASKISTACDELGFAALKTLFAAEFSRRSTQN